MGDCRVDDPALAARGLVRISAQKTFHQRRTTSFPEGYAAGIVLHNLHEGTGKDGVFKAKILGYGAGVTAWFELWRSGDFWKKWGLERFSLVEYWDDFIYKMGFTPKILGTSFRDLTLQWDTSLVLVAAGGLTGIKTGISLLAGGFLNYAILAPIFINKGVIPAAGGFKNITMWGLWGGVAMMTTSSLYTFFSKPKMILDSFRLPTSFRKGGKKTEDVLKDIELPGWISAAGIPIVGALLVIFGNIYFGFSIFEGLIAIPLVFVFTIIAVNSTGLTSITPGSALAKLTQLTYAVVSPGKVATNLMAAGVNAEVSLNASNLLMDIKPAYMLGGKPRHQAVGHVLGIFAGAAVAVPVYYMIFKGDISRFTSDVLPLPSATVWKAVSEALTRGLDVIHPTARWAVVIGGLLGILFEFINGRMKGKFPISGTGMGLAAVLHFNDCLTMGLGSVAFWWFEKKLKDPKTTWHKVLVENRETLCAGGVAGGALIGIILILASTM